MKAVVIQQPHQAEYVEMARPRLRDEQVLVKVAAVGICMSDVELLEGTRPEGYVKYPVQPGHEWCGTLVEVGARARGLTVGQRVAVEGHNFCGACFYCLRGETNLCEQYNEFGFTVPGGYAEYVAARADLAHPFADRLSFDAAVLTEPAACAGHGIARAKIKPGDTVAILGPGTIGLLSAAWAKLYSPKNLIVVGLDAQNETLARAAGATQFVTILDNPSALVRELTNGRGADVVVEAAGNPAAVQLALELTRRGGTLLLEGIAGGGTRAPLEVDQFALKDVRAHGIFSYASKHFVETLRLIESGVLPVQFLVTHSFSLAEFERAFDLLKRRQERVVKVLLKP